MPERHVSATSLRPRRGMYAHDEGSHLSRCLVSASHIYILFCKGNITRKFIVKMKMNQKMIRHKAT